MALVHLANVEAAVMLLALAATVGVAKLALTGIGRIGWIRARWAGVRAPSSGAGRFFVTSSPLTAARNALPGLCLSAYVKAST